jgi:pimeloyl-ACP methyl ester carboxylesterase
MVQTHERTAIAIPDALFTEGYIEADDFRIRYQEADQGEPLASLHGADGMRIYRSHALLAEQYRVIVFEVPGFGQSPTNERSQSMPELALTMAQASTNLGLPPGCSPP